MNLILQRERLNFTEGQLKMIISSWGKESVENSIVEKIVYLSDGLKIKGFLAYPKNTNVSYPSVIWCRGGYGNAGAMDDFTARGIFGQIASWGYTVFASQYRGGGGSEGQDTFGGKDVNDVLNLIPLANELPFADSSRWAIEGWSRGGMMTYLAITKTDIFRTAITIGGITDLHYGKADTPFIKNFYKRVVNEMGEINFEEFARLRSIVNFPEKIKLKTPMLILHGAEDSRVPVGQSLALAEKLSRFEIPYRLIVFEKGDHFLKKQREEVNRLRKFWLDKYLKEQNNG